MQMDAHHLSKRLLAVAKLVPTNARLADIGSDHAYLPAYLALNDQLAFGVAGEVVKGPYQNAKQEIKKEGLDDIIEVRLADGLAAIKATDKINVVTICGMGGTLISDILATGKDKLADHPQLILQPNVGESNVRKWLVENNYQIDSEQIMQEDGHIYEIISASYTPVKQELTEAELIFGPWLLKEKNETFKAKWQKEIAKLETILIELQKASHVPATKKEALQTRIVQIRGVLDGEG